MCGIFGIIRGAKAPIDRASLDVMAERLDHRGPDHRGIFHEPGIALGNNRLSIIDTEGGNQPIFGSDENLVIVYNGEVYNHAEIRRDLEAKGHSFRTRSDTETVLKAFEEFGPDCVTRFNGMFAFAIWDRKANKLFLARDRMGIKPLYICPMEDGFAFASEAKALLPLVPGGVQPDWTAVHQFFTLGYVPPLASPFAGIEKFPAGHTALIEAGERVAPPRPVRFWQAEFGTGDGVAAEDTVAKLDSLLEEAVALELMSDVPLGIFLSGGLDSSAVAYYAAKRHGKKLTSFALRFEEQTHDESADARSVAEHLGLEHKELTLTPEMALQGLGRVVEAMDEPFGDSTPLPLLMLSEFAREHVKAVLTGWGGDEAFAGYPTLKAHSAAQIYRRLPKFLSHGLIPAVVNRLPVSDRYLSFEFKAKRFVRGVELPPELQHFMWMGYFDDTGKNRLFHPDILDQVNASSLAPVETAVAGLSETDLISRIMHLDAEFFLQGNGLFQADRMSMAASLEARVPLLNNNLMDFTMKLPSRALMPGGEPKGLLKRILAPHLPDTIINKPKKGFGPPSSTWVRGLFADLFDDVFSETRVQEAGIFNHGEIHRLIGEHRTRRADHGRNLWALLSFQLWHDRHIHGVSMGIN
ncbi:MAG: asparagine synthase (glutamine-hydrolyzing) [Rhodospirillales bacterium]|nr:asparagine synthase (glutamine-hydrolyzing) [Rhodospirillales bacterium]